jgi:hypothetical protein
VAITLAVCDEEAAVKQTNLLVGTRFGVLAILLVPVLATPVRAAVVPLGSIASSVSPARIAVDAAGQGYTSWADGGSAAALDYCRLPQGTRRCDSRESFRYPAGAGLDTDSGNTPVFTADGQLALLDSRCCLTSNQKFLLLSADGGQTFTAPTPIVSDEASGMNGNVLDLPPNALFAGSPEQLLSSDTGPVTDGGSIQATGLTAPITDPGWFTPSAASGSLSESIGLQGSTLVAVDTKPTSPSYSVSWVRYLGAGDPNAASSWSSPQTLSPAPSLDSNAQLAGGPAGIFVVRSIAEPGDNERLVVQKFRGSGWTSPVAIAKDVDGERFAIDQTPAGIVYVIWTNSSPGALQYAIATSTGATRFGATHTLPTRGDVEFPQIAVDAQGAGWATWTSAGSPDRAFALPIIPPPRITTLRLSDSGIVSLQTPRACLAPGSSFAVALGLKRSKRKAAEYLAISRVVFSVTGSPVKAVRHRPYRATLTLRASTKPGSTVTVGAKATLKALHGHPRTKSIRTKVAVCS